MPPALSMGLGLCPPPRGRERKGGWGLAAWGSAPATPNKGWGLSCPVSLLLLRWVGSWWHPGAGGAARAGGRGWKRGPWWGPGKRDSSPPWLLEAQGAGGQACPALPAPRSLPALQMGRGSSRCLLPAPCPGRGVVGQAPPPCKEGCADGLCLVPCVCLSPLNAVAPAFTPSSSFSIPSIAYPAWLPPSLPLAHSAGHCHPPDLPAPHLGLGAPSLPASCSSSDPQ